ncbi:MAG: sugar phosphate isomerase/epimerase [Candidatus Latescibacterota bacterium]|jgi:sugar phosphate isomerase/epimerase
MKYAFMSFSCPDLALDAMLELAKEIGYDAVEPRTSADHKHGIEIEASASERATIKSKAEAAGIRYSCVATSCRYADPETVAANIAETHQFIDLAADIGADKMRVFGGQMGEDLNREAAIEQVVQALGEVADHAGEKEVTLCLETHDDWCDPFHVATVMAAVDHKNIAVNWDIMHPVRTGSATMDEAYEILEPWIEYVHIHDGSTDLKQLTFKAIGEGDIDHKCALELLMDNGYDGYLSGEWINWEAYEIHLPRELATMKKLEAGLLSASS